MTSHKRAHRQHGEAPGKLFRGYTIGAALFGRKSLKPAIKLVRLSRNKQAAERISRRLLAPH